MCYWKLEGRGPLLCGSRKFSKIVICCKGKAELVRDEPGYLAWVISKQSVEGKPGFFLLLTVQREGER